MRKILISTVHHPNIMNSELINVINHLKKYFDNIYLSVSIVTLQLYQLSEQLMQEEKY